MPSGLLALLPAHLWLAILGGAIGLLISLVIFCCLRSPRRRKLLFLMCTHPNPALGPLYMADERRDEYARELGLKRPPPQFWRMLSVLCCLNSNTQEERLATRQRRSRASDTQADAAAGGSVKQPSQIVDAAALAVTVAAAAVCSAHSSSSGAETGGQRQASRRSRLLPSHSNPSIRWFYQPPDQPRGASHRELNAQQAAALTRSTSSTTAKSDAAAAPAQAAVCATAASATTTSSQYPSSQADDVPPPPGPPPKARRSGRASRDRPDDNEEGGGNVAFDVAVTSASSSSSDAKPAPQPQQLLTPLPLFAAPPNSHPPMLGPSNALEPLVEVPTPPSSCGRASGKSVTSCYSAADREVVRVAVDQDTSRHQHTRRPSHHHRHGSEGRLTREEKEALAGLQLHLNRAASGFLQQELEKVTAASESSNSPRDVGSPRGLTHSHSGEAIPDGAHSPRSESALSDTNRSVFSEGSMVSVRTDVSGRRGDRPGSPHSASARSVGNASSGTNTTATTCREALDSLRLLNQQLTGGGARLQSPSPVGNASVQSAGSCGSGGSDRCNPRPASVGGRPINLLPLSISAADASGVMNTLFENVPQSPSAASQGSEQEAYRATAAARARMEEAAAAATAPSLPAPEVRSRPPRGAAAQAAAAQSLELDAAQILSSFPGLRASVMKSFAGMRSAFGGVSEEPGEDGASNSAPSPPADEERRI